MRIYSRKTCPHFKPISSIADLYLQENSCSHCAYYTDKSCHKSYFDALEYPEI